MDLHLNIFLNIHIRTKKIEILKQESKGSEP